MSEIPRKNIIPVRKKEKEFRRLSLLHRANEYCREKAVENLRWARVHRE